MNQLVSVIVPVYKVEKYLDRCVESIKQQTYSNIEVILVDDGSPDSCGKKCDEFAKNDSRIKVIHKMNGGLSDARNVGIRAAKGDILSFVDSDDWVEPLMIEKMVHILNEYSVDIVTCGFYTIDDKTKTTNYYSKNIDVLSREQAIEQLCKNQKIQSHAWDKIYKREVWEELEFPVGKLYEDVYIMHKVFLKAKSIAFVDEPLYYYYQREGSICSEQSLRSFIDLIEGQEIRWRELANCSHDVREWSSFWIIHSCISVLRIIYALDKIDIPLLNKVYSIFFFYNKGEDFLPKLEGNMRIDYFVIKKMKFLYSLYRRAINNIKKYGIRKKLGIIKRFIKKCISDTIAIMTPVDLAFNKQESDVPRFILLGSPEYNNLGDHAIAYATEEFLKENIPDIPYLEYTETEVRLHTRALKRVIKRNDVLLLQGGGNLGNVYRDQQQIRKKVLKNFPHNRVVLMPQTCYFTENEFGKNELQNTSRLFSEHHNLLLCARERYSFDYMQRVFSKNSCYLFPDIVLSLNREKHIHRQGLGLCIRNDAESILGIAEKQYIEVVGKKYFSDINVCDTCGDMFYKKKERKNAVEKFLNDISKNKLVITDRLHGLIFCAITNTPCIALSNSNYKIRGIYEWLEDYPWIQYCDNLYDIESYIQKLLLLSEANMINIQEEFIQLVQLLKGMI